MKKLKKIKQIKEERRFLMYSPKILSSYNFDTVPFQKLEPDPESYDIQIIKSKLAQLETRLKEVSKSGESPSETLDRIIRLSSFSK